MIITSDHLLVVSETYYDASHESRWQPIVTSVTGARETEQRVAKASSLWSNQRVSVLIILVCIVAGVVSFNLSDWMAVLGAITIALTFAGVWIAQIVHNRALDAPLPRPHR